jgi:hypothetical protein
MSSLSRFLAAVIAAFSSLTFAQVPPPRVRLAVNFDTLPRPPVPSDVLEIVNEAQAVQDAQQRLDAIASLEKARVLSNVRAQPYDLKTSFVSSGGLASDGNWTLEDISRGRMYRWTAQGPNYSAIQMYPDSARGMLYSNQPGGVIPLRLAQVRAAIFFAYQMPGPQASVRTAVGFLNGVEQSCVLVVIGAGNRSFSGGRNWEESEYCMDSKTGLLTTYSPVPGLFVHYDYASAVTFHGKIIPGSFTITEAGRTVTEARTLSVTDPVDSKDTSFNPSGLAPVGVGRAMNPPANFRSLISAPGRPLPSSSANVAVQVVVLHGNVSQDGRLSETEILASSDASLNQAALERAYTTNLGAGQNQPGVTPQSREIFLTFEFVTPGR